MNTPAQEPVSAPDLSCGRCNQPLDPTDKFCRECGLPTLHHAALQRAVPTTPPDTAEFKRAMDLAPDPQPFLRATSEPLPDANASGELTTSSVLKVTSPTFAFNMAGSTLLMVGLIIFLLGVGVFMLVMAIRG